ncbi:hypothetical protein HELRODRAFT_64688 [Helobdella robusta]|uniref:Tetraspanin n=1 Tax=Helobdella robusta TaxID=6412 RepID=T1FXY0_HELRO|nr:hypothetical protein HELRODRAFT_64688 [Helobdella robusta]ESO06401.1 hypothetical protein HELRODRAFT_64688 [Helobdella robusta]
MALKGCYSCIKYLLFAFNFIFWLIGIALLSVGIWIKVNSKSLDDAVRELKSSNDYIYIILIVISILIITIGFLGCCGACRESQCLLGLFFICLLIIFSVIIGVGVFAFTSEGKVG